MNKSQSQAAPVFIIGSYRSGTSVLTWCLGQHPRILALEETNWTAYLSVYLDNLFRLGTVNGEHSNLASIGISQDQFYGFFGKCVSNFFDEYLEQYLDAAKERARLDPELVSDLYRLARSGLSSKERWVDGTPENSHFVYGLSRMYPEAKFIHILRNPDDVARSLQNFSKAGGQDYTEEESYRTWMRLVRASVEAEAALGSERVTRILYADLVANPDRVLRHCLQFIGEDFDESCLMPLQKRINSSGVSNVATSPEHQQLPPYVAEASQLYRGLLEHEPPRVGDSETYQALQANYLEFAKQFRLEEVDRLSLWGQSLDLEIEEANKTIRRLQSEVKKLGEWGMSLDATVAERDKQIADLQAQLEEKKGLSRFF